MARTQSENYPEIRREILRRSAGLFAEKGYPNSTISDLAEANGMSRGLLYHYFASKEAILDEMLNDHLDRMLAEVQAAAGKDGDPETRFRRVIRTIVLINADSKDLQIVLLHDLHNLKDAERLAIVRKQRAILSVISALIKACDRGHRIDDRTLMAHTMMFVGMINYTYIWYDPAGPVGPEEYADMVADTYFGGVRTSATGH